MLRNMELIRRLLIAVEALPYPNEYISFKWADQDAQKVRYHVNLLHEGGLIQAYANPLSCFDEWSQVRLTWEGHELLALLRDEPVWQQAQAAVQERSGGDNLVLLKNYLLQHYS